MDLLIWGVLTVWLNSDSVPHDGLDRKGVVLSRSNLLQGVNRVPIVVYQSELQRIECLILDLIR